MNISSFVEWVDYVFDHPVTDPEWHFDLDAEWWDEEKHPAEAIADMTTLFENPAEALVRFTDEQLGQGFWFLASASCSSHMFALRDIALPWEDRKRCIRAMVPLFKQCFAVRCSSHLSHRNEPDANALNALCFMWFDIIPIHGSPDNAALHEFDAEFLRVLETILALSHDACREAALHGLGEWHPCYPTQTEQMIGLWLVQNPGIRPELKEYASLAQQGLV